LNDDCVASRFAAGHLLARSLSETVCWGLSDGSDKQAVLRIESQAFLNAFR